MLIEELSSKTKRKNEEKKNENRNFLWACLFCARKNGDCSRKSRTSVHDSSVSRANSFICRPRRVEEKSFSAVCLQTSPYDVCITTKKVQRVRTSEKFWACGLHGVVVLLNITYYWIYVLSRNDCTLLSFFFFFKRNVEWTTVISH